MSERLSAQVELEVRSHDAAAFEAAHALHWETSVWPLVISVGILFILPFAFAFKFVYHQPMTAIQ